MPPVWRDDGWISPEWPAPASVRALMTTRAGGVSTGPYQGFNVGDHVGDDPARVSDNRQRLGEALAARPVFLQQQHGTVLAEIDATSVDGLAADVSVSCEFAVACTIMVADCLPVLLCSADGSAVAAAHAGWRGLAGVGGEGVLEVAVRAVRKLQSRHQGPGRVLAWLGPCIGPQAFEVGQEVREAFIAHDSHARDAFKPLTTGKWLGDLPGLARQRLRALGVVDVWGNDGEPAWCTVSQPSRFFSHRRDTKLLGGSGRMAACIWRDGP